MNTKIIGITLALFAMLAATTSFISLSNTDTLPHAPTPDDSYTVDQSDMYTAPTQSTASTTTLTEEEVEWLRHMREEEKLARDVYTTLGERWGLRIFSNIAASEQTHTDAVRTLLQQYTISDPSTDDTVGVFTLPEMQKLYTNLVAQGSTSALDALVVGATIEDLDIHDLNTALSETTNPEIMTVYNDLQKGSRNHLRAFTKNIQSRGGTYTPQYISLDAYTTILATPQEKGRIK